MSLKISYKNSYPKNKIDNLLLFVDENFDLSHLKKYISVNEYAFINDLLKVSDKKSNNVFFNISSKKKIILVSTKKNLKHSDFEGLGAKLYDQIKDIKQSNFIVNSDSIKNTSKNIIGYFLHGMKLKSYIFEKYKSKKKNKRITITVIGKNIPTKADQLKFTAIEEGTFYARDLVSEPGNILHPDEYAKRLNTLKKFGLKINILNEQKMKKLGMNTLLGVGQGSIRGSYLVTMEWKGLKDNSKPLAFVGKGVCFDTGGISLKPAKFMEDMTYDMAGSATVVGLMKSLALKKAKVNAIGVVGLVENMPGGNAQRPGDIVKSYSGKTVEILNTDAEGRLILADCLTFVGKYKPSYVIDMATLTGAVVIALGRHASGVMTNDQHLADKIIEAGEESGDRAWQLPLWDEHQSCTKTKYADLANIGGGREAGTIHAAAFLSKFTNDYKWAHIDIAATASYSSPVKAGTGRPVPLISELLLSKKLK